MKRRVALLASVFLLCAAASAHASSWTAPQRIEVPPNRYDLPRTTFDPRVVFAPSGRGFVVSDVFPVSVCESHCDNQPNAVTAVRPAGGSWPATTADLPPAVDTGELVADGRDGAALGVAETQDPFAEGIYEADALDVYSYAPAHGTFAPADRVWRGEGRILHVAANGAGAAAVIWQAGSRIYAARRSPGKRFGKRVLLASGIGDSAATAAAVGPAGDVALAWVRGSSVYARRGAPGKGLVRAQRVGRARYAPEAGVELAAGVDSGGRATIAWTRTQGKVLELWSARASRVRGFGLRRQLDVWTGGESNSFWSALTVVASGGETVAAWVHARLTESSVRTASFRGADVSVGTVPGSDGASTELSGIPVGLAGGRVAVAFSLGRYPDERAFVSVREPAGDFGAPEPVSSADHGLAGLDLAMDPLTSQPVVAYAGDRYVESRRGLYVSERRP